MHKNFSELHHLQISLIRCYKTVFDMTPLCCNYFNLVMTGKVINRVKSCHICGRKTIAILWGNNVVLCVLK